jgi:group I intron endonuclease
MKLPRQVYALQHNPTQKMYIGSSADVKRRIQNHMKALRNGIHPVGDMQEDFFKYGEDYTVVILDEIKDWPERIKEYFWMKKYNTCTRGVGYNYKDHAKKKLSEVR